MKSITNWRNATVADIEANGLLDEATRIHVLSCTMSNNKSYDLRGSERQKLINFCNYHINNNIPVVGHYFILFDVPLLEKILGVDLSKLMVVDTLALSWYLNIERDQHGLDSFFDDYGIKKPFIDEADWDFQSEDSEEVAAHYERMRFRCEQDVAINKALWGDLQARLIDMYTRVKDNIDKGFVDGRRVSEDEVCYIDSLKGLSVDEHIDRILTFLMFKMDCARLQEKTRFRADREWLLRTEAMLSSKIEEARVELEGVMPKVPIYGKKDKPKKPFLKNGDLSASGLSWNEAIEGITNFDEYGKPLSLVVDKDTIKVLKGYEEPNINSHQQIKDWLYSLGWKPVSFKYVKDKKAQQVWADSGFKKELKPEVRKIPQLSIDTDEGKDLCPSVIKLAEDVPEIMAYSKYTMVKHRHDTIKGFISAMSEDGYLKARIGGFTNTLRVAHRELVNLVGVDKPYGEEIRGALTCLDDEILIGSDLSSLEDRVKHTFMIPYDPDYVATMMDEKYDPHIATALSAKLITQEEFDDFMKGVKSDNAIKQRRAGKTTNYCSVYNGSADTIALSAGIDLSLAKQLHKGYWELNWAVKSIAEDLCVIVDKFKQKWLINPINGFCYNIRKDSDRFSTLCQGTGSFFFDMWVDNILDGMEEGIGEKVLIFQAHDEYVSRAKDTPANRELLKDITIGAINKVNRDFKLRRELGCQVCFGKRYSEIH